MFDGADDLVSAPDSPTLSITNQITLEAWVFPTGAGGGTGPANIIINKEPSVSQVQYEISRKNPVGCVSGTGVTRGNFMFYLRGVTGLPNNCDDWVDGGAPIPANVWTHVALTYDGANATTFVNGSLTRTVPATGAMAISSRSNTSGINSTTDDNR